jgi:hypothetical protein
MSDYIENLKVIIDLPKTGIKIEDKSKCEEIYNSLVKVFGSDISSDEENCLIDIANTIVAMNNGQIEKESSLVITSEIVNNKSKYIKKVYGLNLILLEDYIQQIS